jgi:putative Holliday junction resolvase
VTHAQLAGPPAAIDNPCMSPLLAIDVGTKTLGLAVSDPGRTVALPLGTIRRRGLGRDIEELARIVEERDIGEVVVGLPLNMDGTPGAMSGEVEAVAERLAARCGVVTHRWDERLTTAQVERMLIQGDVSRRRRKQVVDKLAATVILQAYLDAASGAGLPGGGLA